MPDQPIRILVVDDDFATRLLACEALLADGFEPHEAEDGREALAHYDRKQPEAILLDVNMPGIDGYEVCRRIRMRPGGESTAVMVVTANDDVDAVQRAFAAGATDFLTKPLNLPLLAHRVRYMLRATATATTARETASRLARAQRLARLAHWQLGSDGQLMWASDPLAVFWPDAADDQRAGLAVGAGADPLLSLVHPDDRDWVGGMLAARSAHQIEFRLVFPDGSERIVHQDAELEYGERGVVLIGATQDITDQKRAEQQIAQLAYYDDLTGIANRPFLERYLRFVDPAVSRAAIAIDLGTAHVERLTTAARDLLLRAATARVIERVRGGDVELRLDQAPRPIEAFTGAVFVARTGADELLVVTSAPAGGTAPAAALQVAEALAIPFTVAGKEVMLRPRLGVAEYPDPIGDLYRLGDLARGAMQDAERQAPRNVVVMTAAARTQRIRRIELSGRLALALDADALSPRADLSVEYVSRLEFASRRVFGVRARPRWLPAAHEPQSLTGLVVDPVLRERLAHWTLRQACRDAARWLAGGVAVRLAVELPHALLSPAFADDLARLFADTGFEPMLLDLELIDLPTADHELERVAAVLHAAHALGARVVLGSVDDRCSLGVLRRLPIDALRLECTTIDRLGPSFLATTAALARGLELRIAITELDTPAALAVLDAHEPHELSGALFGAAVSAADVPGLTVVDVMPERLRRRPDSTGALLAIE